MDFGRVPSVDDIDFTLPPDPAGTAAVLRAQPPTSAPASARLGLPRWADPGFVGTLYPAGTRAGDYLARYAEQLDAVELNTTYYGVRADSVRGWVAQVTGRFRFCPKVPKAVTHEGSLRAAEAEMDAFVAACADFGERLGVAWALLPPSFGAGQLADLARFVERYGPRLPLAVELRHASWFEGGAAFGEACALFESCGVTTVLTDVAGRRDVVHMRLTTPRLFLRFVGNRHHPSDFARIDAWSERIAAWSAAGLREAWLFLHQPEEHLNVPVARRLAESLVERGISVRRPVPIRAPARQGELF
jgi:uncharacterized protein YecE (DUF72 family)